jgi:magnesium and cobalt transporter
VGDIQDEHDAGEVQMITADGDGYLVDASLQVADLQDVFRTDYEQEDYDTVGGLMYHLFGRVPKSGDRVKWHDYKFEIRSVDGQRIQWVFVLRRTAKSSHQDNSD